MGIRLVKAAYVALADAKVTPSARTVLIWMAMTARDEDSPPRYFAGREVTAFALGRRIPDEPYPDDPDRDDINREREAAFRRLQDAMTSLERAQLITRLKSAARGRTAEYRLELTPRLKPVEHTTENVAHPPTETVGNTRRKPSAMHDGKRRAEDRGGLKEEERGRNQLTKASTSRAPVERAS
ncbi:MAG: hypothetical protein KJ659_09085 [Actinobacteria bacterium]|nr:hypothetical protein [Actinomycetota bacterium]MBU1607819.1 hypothetical protein [Actinomycetota bacterium]MBU2314673.1 hypothetical protein [Actinomycetota bacterium]MBU2385634.1 hypothetical protein [Actinomycetota bacterium]